MNEWNLEPDMKGGRYMAKVKPAISSVYFFIYCFSPIIEIGSGWVECMDMINPFSGREQ